jgi:hypothetical protein
MRRPCIVSGRKTEEMRPPIDVSGVLIVQLGLATEDLNRR